MPSCGRNCRRLVGLIWFATWSGLIYLTVLPWRNLGGLVSEWLLWLERFVLYWGDMRDKGTLFLSPRILAHKWL